MWVQGKLYLNLKSRPDTRKELISLKDEALSNIIFLNCAIQHKILSTYGFTK